MSSICRPPSRMCQTHNRDSLLALQLCSSSRSSATAKSTYLWVCTSGLGSCSSHTAIGNLHELIIGVTFGRPRIRRPASHRPAYVLLAYALSKYHLETQYPRPGQPTQCALPHVFCSGSIYYRHFSPVRTQRNPSTRYSVSYSVSSTGPSFRAARFAPSRNSGSSENQSW
jgi:hypothetical protein